MSDSTPVRTRMTLEEFRALPETNTPVELIHGELIVSPAPKNAHQEAVGSIYYYLRGLSREAASGAKVIVSPSDVYLDSGDVVQPDVFWVTANGTCKLGDDGYWHGAPDLAVEVLSPGTEDQDRGVKYDLYEQNGVREYWIIQPEKPFVEVYVLTDGQFTRRGLFGKGQTFVSPVLGGVAVSVDALFE